MILDIFRICLLISRTTKFKLIILSATLITNKNENQVHALWEKLFKDFKIYEYC